MSFISSLGEWLRKISKSFTSASISGQNITLTRHNGDTVVLTTQDTVTTVSTFGSGNAVTNITADNGALSVTKDNTFSLSNHTHSDLPLTGGTMTGAITFDDLNNIIKSADNIHQITILGGSASGSQNGAKLYLSGADHADEGAFILQAGNANGYKQLIGKPDGSLTWEGSDVVTVEDIPLSSNVSTIPYTFKIKLPNGLMLQAYYSNAFQTDANSRITWTYAEAFTGDPFVFVQKSSASNSFNLYSWNSTRAIIRCNNMSGTTVGSGVTIAAIIFAIGRWK